VTVAILVVISLWWMSSVNLIDPPGVKLTLGQMGSGPVPAGTERVTVSGYTRDSLVETNALYNGGVATQGFSVSVLTNQARTAGLVVLSPEPLGDPGSEVTITGVLQEWAPDNPWEGWAAMVLPSAQLVRNAYIQADPTPASPLWLVPGLALLLLAAWLLAGCLAGYVVFIPSRLAPAASGAAYPGRYSQVRVSGAAVDLKGRGVALREVPMVKRPDYAAATAGVTLIDCSLVPWLEIDVSAICEARPGGVYPWHGPRPAVQISIGKKLLVVSFDDFAARDGWLRVFGQAAPTTD
jgi:hypothetical protein